MPASPHMLLAWRSFFSVHAVNRAHACIPAHCARSSGGCRSSLHAAHGMLTHKAWAMTIGAGWVRAVESSVEMLLHTCQAEHAGRGHGSDSVLA